VTDKAKQSYRDCRTAKDDKRPFYLGILDEDGNVLRAVEMRADGATEDVTEQEQSKPLRPRPEPADNGDWLAPR
jgi:hypothetical protein